MNENPLSHRERLDVVRRLLDLLKRAKDSENSSAEIGVGDLAAVVALAMNAPLAEPTGGQRAAAARLMEAAQNGKIRGDDVQSIIDAAWVSTPEMDVLRHRNEALVALLGSAGKIILALAGHVPGYLPETDAIHAALKDAST